jgi:hypothetical protein
MNFEKCISLPSGKTASTRINFPLKDVLGRTCFGRAFHMQRGLITPGARTSPSAHTSRGRDLTLGNNADGTSAPPANRCTCRFKRRNLSGLPMSPFIVLSSGSRYSNSFLASARRKLWLKKKSARTRRVRVRNRRTVSTAARHAKARATQSSSIVIAATNSVREISE